MAEPKAVEIGPFQDIAEVGWPTGPWLVMRLQWVPSGTQRFETAVRIPEIIEHIHGLPPNEVSKWLGPAGIWLEGGTLEPTGIDRWDAAYSGWGDAAFLESEAGGANYPVGFASYRFDLEKIKKRLPEGATQFGIEVQSIWGPAVWGPISPVQLSIKAYRRTNTWTGHAWQLPQLDYSSGAEQVITEKYLENHNNSRDPMRAAYERTINPTAQAGPGVSPEKLPVFQIKLSNAEILNPDVIPPPTPEAP